MDTPYKIRIYRRYGKNYFGHEDGVKFTVTYEDVYADHLTDALTLVNKLKNKFPVVSIVVFWGDSIIDSYNSEQVF